jgi:hypothetical protein
MQMGEETCVVLEREVDAIPPVQGIAGESQDDNGFYL